MWCVSGCVFECVWVCGVCMVCVCVYVCMYVYIHTYKMCAVLQIGRSLVRSQLVSLDFSLT